MTLPFYIALILFFVIGYVFIIFEKLHNINKAATALLMAVGCWFIFFLSKIVAGGAHEFPSDQLTDIAAIIFFLMAVMAIVEVIDSHHGFKIVTDLLRTPSRRKMFWLVLTISFFMSSVLDNLTSMIVMISLLRKLIPEKEDRWLLGSLVVIAVNAGGAWTPIGDVTTTMLWIHGAITSWNIMKSLFLPSVACTVVAGVLGMVWIKGKKPLHPPPPLPIEPGGAVVFFAGLCALILIPVWKALFGLPPFMGALVGLAFLWIITDLMHYHQKEDRRHLRVPFILTKIDISGVLFFLGILLAVSSLTSAGILKDFADLLEKILPNQNYVAVFIGLLSSVVDNVPLVAATFGMYDLATYPTDASLWELIAYAAGTGGSILIIGSAAGVAFMGLEHVDFFWYFKKITWVAFISYFAGLGVYFLQQAL